jgi:Domain of unknown function (DUF5134)
VSVPAWLLDTFAAVVLLVAAVSAARLAIAWRAGRRSDPDADIDVSHLLMGLAMAGTLTVSLSTLPSGAWEVIFGALTLWFAYPFAREYRGRGLRALVSEHHAPHLLHSAAMLYMFLALRTVAPGHSTSSAMASMSGISATGGQSLRLPTLALLFAFLLCAYVVADLDRVPAPPAPALARLHLATPAPAPSMALAGVPSSAAPALTSPPPTQALTATQSPAASPAPEAPALSGLLSPGVARGCRIAMGVTMAFMLITMI